LRKLDRGNSEFILDTLLDTFCGANDAKNAAFAGGIGVKSLIIR
jgi:hypothetical protein